MNTFNIVVSLAWFLLGVGFYIKGGHGAESIGCFIMTKLYLDSI